MPSTLLSVADEAQRIARKTFGYKSLRPDQLQTTEALMSGRDVFLIKPTGGGKSVAYQLPAMMSEGTTIVFSPLIALMTDQITKLTKWGVPATRLSADMDDEDCGYVLRRLHKYRMIYVAPERARSVDFVRAVRKSKISLVAVDECHMLTEAGYRPAYASLGEFIRKYLPTTPRIALTATADEDIEEQVARMLGMENYVRVTTDMSRPNLNYSAVHEWDPREIAAWIRRNGFENKPGKGLIYAATRKGTTFLANELTKYGIRSIEAYHAGLGPKRRDDIQARFTSGQTKFLTATNAFGMGVDIPDIRFVLHADPPDSIYNLVQEMGRAGRDGLPSECVLNITEKGLKSRRFFLRVGNPPPAVYKAVWMEIARAVPVGEAEIVCSIDLERAVCGQRISSFEAGYTADAVLNYLDTAGAITTKPDKVVHTLAIRDKNKCNGWRLRRPKNIRMNPYRQRVTVTVFPGEDDPVPAMLASGAVQEAVGIFRPVKYTRVFRKRMSHGISPAELYKKSERASSKLASVLEYASAEDKSAFIRAIFERRAEPLKGEQ